MIELEINDVAKETVQVLNLFNPSFTKKVSTQFLEHLNKLAKNSTKNVIIDKDKRLKDQNISNETKDLISLIYYNYIATEEDKQKLVKIWNQNEIEYQKELNQKYNIIFKNEQQSTVNYDNRNSSDDKIYMVKYKETFIQKIIKLIKKFFKK